MSRGDHGPHGRSSDGRGNKAYLPSKPCASCGRAMTWRKAWARSWGDVKYCSDGCRAAARRARGGAA